jgi:Fur family iron response transcriptional regulator
MRQSGIEDWLRTGGRFFASGGNLNPRPSVIAWTPEALQLGRAASCDKIIALRQGWIGPMTPPRPFTNVLELLRGAHLRPTQQRLALARLLFEQADRHVTAEQLHGEVVGASVRVSLATVYNTLHQFIEAGLLREVVVNSGRSYFDTNVSYHHHFFFEDSGRLLDIPGEHVTVSGVPKLPTGATIRRIDVIIRVDRDRVDPRRRRAHSLRCHQLFRPN